jgi:hypothetical protein
MLLPCGVAQLLSIACDDSLAEPWPRVRPLLCCAGVCLCAACSGGSTCVEALRRAKDACLALTIPNCRPARSLAHTPVTPCQTLRAAKQVHAFNTLRHVFSDASLAFDASGFHAAGVVAAINGMTDGAWEVRGAAHMSARAGALAVAAVAG